MQRFIRITLVSMLCLTAGMGLLPAQPLEAVGVEDYEPGQIVVKLASSLGDDILGVNQTYGTTTAATLFHHDDVLLLQAPAGADVEQLAQLMTADPRLEYAEPNYINESPEDGSTDRIYGWGGQDPAPLKSQDANKTMRLEAAHGFEQGQGTLVAVLDTGVQMSHPALADNLSALGFDFVDNDPAPEDEANGLDDDGDGRVDETVGHGTHVAGIVLLVAPEASILPVRVLNSDGRGNDFRTANAILYAAYAGADAVNLSLGTTQPSAVLRDAVSEAAGMGVVVVAAAGNLNSLVKQYPAAEACAIAVTSVDAKDRKSSFAGYGDWIGVAAPGENIYSAFPVDGFAWWSGTSMSTPFVAGQAALLRGVNPELTLDEIGLLIGGTARSLNKLNPTYRGLLGEGVIDIVASLESQAAGAWPAAEHNVLADCSP